MSPVEGRGSCPFLIRLTSSKSQRRRSPECASYRASPATQFVVSSGLVVKMNPMLSCMIQVGNKLQFSGGRFTQRMGLLEVTKTQSFSVQAYVCMSNAVPVLLVVETMRFSEDRCVKRN